MIADAGVVQALQDAYEMHPTHPTWAETMHFDAFIPCKFWSSADRTLKSITCDT